MASLPSLRRKIHSRFLLIIALYGILGFVLVTSVFFASDHTPKIIAGAIIYFIISILMSFFIADGLSDRLARPLKDIAEALHQRPTFGRKLKLPEPTSLEIFVLSAELNRLWERLALSEKVNVSELLQQKLKLETLLESLEDGLVFLDINETVSHCNSRLARIVGLNENQIQGHPWRDLPSVNENYLRLRELLNDDMKQGQEIEFDVGGIKYKYSARSREILASPDSLAPVIQPDSSSGASGAMDSIPGKRIGRLFLLHDITEKRQREKFRAEFIDLLSHEIKTPLQSLGIASDLLMKQKAEFSKELVILVETISEDVERIRAVTQELVQVTFTQTKLLKLKPQIVALSQSLPEWIKPLFVIGRDRKVKIEFLNEGSEVIRANIDPAKFPWVISNLVSNAIRFSPPDSLVRVILTDRNGAVEIQVKDDGTGISEQDQKHIFDPFFHGACTLESGQRGLFGIGLTIVKDVVEAHEGRIEFYPRLPQGSEFRIILPFPPNV